MHTVHTFLPVGALTRGLPHRQNHASMGRNKPQGIARVRSRR